MVFSLFSRRDYFVAIGEVNCVLVSANNLILYIGYQVLSTMYIIAWETALACDDEFRLKRCTNIRIQIKENIIIVPLIISSKLRPALTTDFNH